MQAQLNGITLTLASGDIFTATTDAIVLSATPDLSLQTEIGKQLLNTAGLEVGEECKAIGFCDMGQVAVTSGGSLAAQYIIHAVGPVMGSGNERGKLSSAVWNALKAAEERKFNTLAFSPISIGQFGYPVESCAAIMAQKIVDFTFEDLEFLKSIHLLTPDDHIYSIFESILRQEVATALEETGANAKSSL